MLYSLVLRWARKAIGAANCALQGFIAFWRHEGAHVVTAKGTSPSACGASATAKPHVFAASQRGGAMFVLGASVFLADSTMLRSCSAGVCEHTARSLGCSHTAPSLVVWCVPPPLHWDLVCFGVEEGCWLYPLWSCSSCAQQRRASPCGASLCGGAGIFGCYSQAYPPF